jgi:hypothetical protein
LDVSVEDLLLLGVMIENGGVFMRKWDSIVVDGFEWVE